MDQKEVIVLLKKHANPNNVAGMARFGINPKNTLGIGIPYLRELAKKIGKNHQLAQQLWKTKIHEARLLAGFIDDHKLVTVKQMESWVKDFDSWDICDQVCSTLFDKTPYAYPKAKQWAKRKEEFVRRAGFVMMACLAVHDKKAPDKKLQQFFPLIEKYSTDERNFVKKAVNWALRQIGKRRNSKLRKPALALSAKLSKADSPSARWIGKDAFRELKNLKKLGVFLVLGLLLLSSVAIGAETIASRSLLKNIVGNYDSAAMPEPGNASDWLTISGTTISFGYGGMMEADRVYLVKAVSRKGSTYTIKCDKKMLAIKVIAPNKIKIGTLVFEKREH